MTVRRRRCGFCGRLCGGPTDEMHLCTIDTPAVPVCDDCWDERLR